MFQHIQQMNKVIDAEERAEESNSSSPTREGELEGVLFGKYEIGRLVGVGGFAKVYEACHVLTKQKVAIKVMNKCDVEEQRITVEIAAMSRLNHPHIVKLYEVLTTETKIFLVMEFAKGGELFNAFVNEGPFSEDQHRRWLQQLISAVQHCHSHGVFHRDLKLENLLLDEKLNIKVSDFGLSATTENIQPDGKLHTLCGTTAYLAPEMISKKGYDGDKIDVWQCGVVLYVLTFQSLPLDGPDARSKVKEISRGLVCIPYRDKPENLRHLIKRLLDPNPITRITIDEIMKDPWFKKGTQRSAEEAFHLISSHLGLDISGLFTDSPDPTFEGDVKEDRGIAGQKMIMINML